VQFIDDGVALDNFGACGSRVLNDVQMNIDTNVICGISVIHVI
jgi:hypothetical protein